MNSLLKKPIAWLPIAMSLIAFAFTVGYVAIFGVVHHEDEGTPAHIFQLLMGGQALIAVFFAMTWLPKKPKETLQILALQILAALVAFTPVYFLEL